LALLAVLHTVGFSPFCVMTNMVVVFCMITMVAPLLTHLVGGAHLPTYPPQPHLPYQSPTALAPRVLRVAVTLGDGGEGGRWVRQNHRHNRTYGWTVVTPGRRCGLSATTVYLLPFPFTKHGDATRI